MTGADTGATHIHATFSGLHNTPAVTVTGTSSSSYDGTTRTGIPVAPQACPSELPRPPQTAIATRVTGTADHREAVVTVTATVPDAGPNEGHSDTRPVTSATVTLGGQVARTDNIGEAILPLPPKAVGRVTIRVRAGDTLAPSEATLDIGPAGGGTLDH
ncbi:hypothetical protein BH10ACT9_BH10ACT9_28280 [soil metagenome]